MSQYVTLTSKGKVRISVPGSLKYTFKNLLELFINDKVKGRLTRVTVGHLMEVANMDELYCKYHTQLCLMQGDVKLLLTLSQAYALWDLCQEYEKFAYTDAVMGDILMQLHQKLS